MPGNLRAWRWYLPDICGDLLILHCKCKGIGWGCRSKVEDLLWHLFATEEGKEKEGEKGGMGKEGGEGRKKGRASVGEYLGGEIDHRTADN